MDYEDMDFDPYGQQAQGVVGQVYGGAEGQPGAALGGRDQNKVSFFLLKKLLSDRFGLDRDDPMLNDIAGLALDRYYDGQFGGSPQQQPGLQQGVDY